MNYVYVGTFRGGKGSGWYAPPKGTHTGEKHRKVGSGKSGRGATKTVGGKSGKAVAKLRLVSKKATKHVKDDTGDTFYHSKYGAQFPSDVSGMTDGVILYQPKTGDIYAASGEDEPLTHVDLMYDAGIPSTDDTWARLWVDDGKMYADFRQAGVPYKNYEDVDVRAAERNIVRSAKALVRAGFDPDMRFLWVIDSSKRTESSGFSNDVRLDLKLGKV